MKLGKMLSMGEVVEDSVPEETMVAETAPESTAAERIEHGAVDRAAPAPVVTSVER
jgi:hypothetical protein